MIKTKKDLVYYKQQDVIMNGFVNKNKLWGVKQRLNKRFKFLKLLREAEYYKNNFYGINKLIFYFKYYRLKKIGLSLGFSIEPNCFGPGLSIPHYGTIIVNPSARIGKNCRLHCCTNIGASAGSNKAPEIGDNVYIGPGAIIFGNIQIGNNVTIGANATVNKTCLEEYSVIAGTPAVVVKKNMPNWLSFNKIENPIE